MEPSRFDQIAQFVVARRLSRRRALRAGAARLAAGAFAAGIEGAAAHGVTPAATPASEPTQYLFVQSFQAGSIAPMTGATDAFTLTLEDGLGQTIYFADRPDRAVGVVPTGSFLDAFSFTPDNPPNAALVVDTGGPERAVVVLELLAPRYDEATRSASYEATVLSNFETSDFHLGITPAAAADLPPRFGTAHLFIDSSIHGQCDPGVCPCSVYCQETGTISCHDRQTNQELNTISDIPFCPETVPGSRCVPGPQYDWDAFCGELIQECNGDCQAVWIAPPDFSGGS